jgi:hypothetical protein
VTLRPDPDAVVSGWLSLRGLSRFRRDRMQKLVVSPSWAVDVPGMHQPNTRASDAPEHDAAVSSHHRNVSGPVHHQRHE